MPCFNPKCYSSFFRQRYYCFNPSLLFRNKRLFKNELFQPCHSIYWLYNSCKHSTYANFSRGNSAMADSCPSSTPSPSLPACAWSSGVSVPPLERVRSGPPDEGRGTRGQPHMQGRGMYNLSGQLHPLLQECNT